MKKKIIFLQGLYYLLIPCVFVAFFYCSSLLIPDNASLGTITIAIYGIVFVGTPVVVATLMRFSLLRWYVDPFAAAETPLAFCGLMLTTYFRREISFAEALSKLGEFMTDKGWFFLIGLFLFGLIASFSPARKEGRNMIYTQIEKL